MICSGCGAHLIDGTKKCPFCQELLVPQNSLNGRAISNDVTYTIDSKKQFEFIKNSTQSGISSSKIREKRRKKRIKMIKGYTILGLMAIALIAVIIGIIALFVNIFSDNNKYTTAFFIDNSLSVVYDGEVVTLSEKAVNLKTIDEDASLADIISTSSLIQLSDDGKTTCFIDNYDEKKKSGTLKVMKKDNSKGIITIAENVFNRFLLSDDGEHILFIKNANTKGNRGELWYSNRGDKAVKIAEKVDASRFVLSLDGKTVAYIKNYNYTGKSGDAYCAEIGDFTEKKLDKEVYELYGSSLNGKNFIYSKNYNGDTESFDLYIKSDDKANRVVMGCGNPPTFSQNGEYMFVCGDKNDERYSLYRIKADKINTEKIISNMNGIVKISADGEQVMYSKLFDNNVGDYYIWTEGEREIKVADGVNYTKENQVAVSEDFEKIAYIANFDENKKGGLLYYCEYSKDSATVAEKISEDVYDCYVLKNKNIVYNKNYNSSKKFAQLYIYTGAEQEINPEINPRFVMTSGNDIICLYDYSSEAGGSLYIIDEDLRETKVTTDVFGFNLKANNALLIKRNKNAKSGKFDLYETDKNKENLTLVIKDIQDILVY